MRYYFPNTIEVLLEYFILLDSCINSATKVVIQYNMDVD